MSVMTIREFSADVSQALSRVEGGEDIVLTRNGRPTVRLTREGSRSAETMRGEAVDALRKLMDVGVRIGGPATYEDRTGC